MKLFATVLAATLASAAFVSTADAQSYGGSGWFPGKGALFCRSHPYDGRCNGNGGYRRPVAVYGGGGYGGGRGWYPGKGMMFCRAHPEDYRCNR